MAATAGVRRFNVLRFNWSNKKDVSLSRLDFSRQILQRLLEVKPEDLNCLIKHPGIDVSFDVSFVSNGAMEKCLEVYNKKKKDAPFSQFLVEPLSDREIKVVTIQFYSEVVNDYDIETWLHRHCKVKSSSRKVKDADDGRIKQQAAGLAVVEKEAEAESQGNKEAQFGNEEESLEEGSSSSSSSEFEFEEEGVVDQRKRPVKRKPEEEEGFDIKKKVGGGIGFSDSRIKLRQYT
ncbi:UNVERIFIED_CONTAM: hypothetical protein FKN15_077271 [Acipenser sinensis]